MHGEGGMPIQDDAFIMNVNSGDLMNRYLDREGGVFLGTAGQSEREHIY